MCNWLTEMCCVLLLRRSLFPHLWNILRLSPSQFCPFTVGPFLLAMSVSFLLLFDPGQEKGAQARLRPTQTQVDLCSGTPARTQIPHKGPARNGGWILLWLLFQISYVTNSWEFSVNVIVNFNPFMSTQGNHFSSQILDLNVTQTRVKLCWLSHITHSGLHSQKHLRSRVPAHSLWKLLMNITVYFWSTH